jgi:hypothetical protein
MTILTKANDDSTNCFNSEDDTNSYNKKPLILQINVKICMDTPTPPKKKKKILEVIPNKYQDFGGIMCTNTQDNRVAQHSSMHNHQIYLVHK